MEIDIKDLRMIIGVCAFVFGMYFLVIGDLNNNIEEMIWGVVLVILWGGNICQ